MPGASVVLATEAGAMATAVPRLSEQLGFVVEMETVDEGEDCADYWRLEGPNQWPHELPEIQAIVAQWMGHLSTISLALLRALAPSFGGA